MSFSQKQMKNIVFDLINVRRTCFKHECFYSNLTDIKSVIYRFESEFSPVIDLRLKIEINTREHFSVLGLKQIPFQVTNSWLTGKCDLPSSKQIYIDLQRIAITWYKYDF